MFGLLFLLLVLSLSTTIDSKCIGTYKELEKEILSNDENLHSLLKAFFPTNQYPGIWVEIQYYINSTDDYGNITVPIHPLAVLISNNNISYSPDYIFYWASSAVLAFAHYELLQGLSFYMLNFEPQVSYIVIPEFCAHINNNTIKMKLINDATIWMKSYAVNGRSSIEEGVEYHLQGFSQYKLNENSVEIELINISYDNEIYFMNAALVVFSLSSYFLGVYLIAKNYDKVCKMCNQPKTGEQRFRFRSIFWAVIVTISVLNGWALILGTIHIVDFGFEWEDRNGFIYIIVAVFLPICMCVSLILSVIIISYKLLISSDQQARSPPSTSTTQTEEKISSRSLAEEDQRLSTCNFNLCKFFAQILAVFEAIVLTVILPIFLYGLMLGLLVNPAQIFAWITSILLASLIAMYFLAHLIDTFTDTSLCNRLKDFSACRINMNSHLFKCMLGFARAFHGDNIINKICEILFLIFHITIGISLVAFIIMFSFVYIRVILFTGVDNTGIVSGAGQLFPSLILALLLWSIKKEYEKYDKAGTIPKDNDEEGTVQAPADDDNNNEEGGAPIDNNNEERGGPIDENDEGGAVPELHNYDEL